MQSVNIRIQACLQPGEPVLPTAVVVKEKKVNIRYPHSSGIQQNLEGTELPGAVSAMLLSASTLKAGTS